MNNIESQKGEIVMYQPDETIRLEVRMEGETVWLSANQMSLLFDRDEKTNRKHINNVFSDNEVPKAINTHFLRVDGVKQPVAFYTLDVIISVGYRVKSKKGTAFRQWANKVLKAMFQLPSTLASSLNSSSSTSNATTSNIHLLIYAPLSGTTIVSWLSTMWYTSLVPAWRMQARNSSPTSKCKKHQQLIYSITSDKTPYSSWWRCFFRVIIILDLRLTIIQLAAASFFIPPPLSSYPLPPRIEDKA